MMLIATQIFLSSQVKSDSSVKLMLNVPIASVLFPSRLGRRWGKSGLLALRLL